MSIYNIQICKNMDVIKKMFSNCFTYIVLLHVAYGIAELWLARKQDRKNIIFRDIFGNKEELSGTIIGTVTILVAGVLALWLVSMFANRSNGPPEMMQYQM